MLFSPAFPAPAFPPCSLCQDFDFELPSTNIELDQTMPFQIQTLNKLAKPSTRTNARLATPNKSTASLRHTQDDQSDDDLCLNHSIIPLSRPFIDRQLKASMNHLEEYRHHVHSRLNSIHLAIVDKVKQATKIEACLMRMTQVIPKQTDGNALGFQVDGTGRKESEQEEQEYEDSIVKTAKQDLLTTNVRSYGCLVKTLCTPIWWKRSVKPTPSGLCRCRTQR